MLRNNLSDQAAKVYQPAAPFSEKHEKKPLVGKSVYSRRGDLVGYSVQLDSNRSLASRGVSGVVRNAETYIVLLNRIVRACACSALSSHTGGEVRGLGVESRVIMGLQPQALLIERFISALTRATEEVKKQGFGLCVAFEASDLAFIRDFREFRQVLYKLGDHGVKLIMRNPVLTDPGSDNTLVVERAVSAVSITPEWLGIGASENSFDHSRYFEQVTRLSSLIHEEAKIVVLEGVQNEWQESFVSSLPIAYFSLRQSDDDVYV